MWVIETALDLVDAAALALILAVGYGAVLRVRQPGLLLRLAGGVLFGLAGWAAMLSPVEFPQGMLIDLRAVFIVLSAAFLGWHAGLITLAMVIVGRSAFFPLPPQGWSLMAWVHVGLTGQYLAALGWRALRHRMRERSLGPALLLVVMTQSAALALTAWDTLLAVPNLGHILAAQYGARVFGLLAAALIMLREEALVRIDGRNRDQALRDHLTGVLNRRGLETKLSRMESYRTLGVFCIDFDRFKQLNDTRGHATGDAVLEAGARGLRHALPVDGLLARFGGDEFVGVVPDINPAQMAEVADRLVAVIAGLRTPWLYDVPATVSVGHAVGGPEDTLETLMHRADAALYAAKAEGGNRARSDHAALSGQAPRNDLPRVRPARRATA